MFKLLKTYKKLIMILILPYLAVLFVLVYPTNLSVTAPGGLTPVEAFVSIEGYEMNQNFYTVYVYNYYPITLFQSWILKNDETMDIDEMTIYEEEISLQENYIIGQLAKEVSITRSIISAYSLAKETNTEVEIDYHFAGLYLRRRPNQESNLKIGDLIVEIDGVSFEGYEPLEFLELLDDQDVEFTMLRDGSEVTLAYQKEENDLPLAFYAYYEIDHVFPLYQVKDENTNVGGPSGGLLQALNIYASLVNINIDDLKISGTGTIDVDGNVGEIGGLPQKTYTAIRYDVDLFFYPESQQNELINMNLPYHIIPVSTLREAVNALYDFLDE